jgi:hypothetical protein
MQANLEIFRVMKFTILQLRTLLFFLLVSFLYPFLFFVFSVLFSPAKRLLNCPVASRLEVAASSSADTTPGRQAFKLAFQSHAQALVA